MSYLEIWTIKRSLPPQVEEAVIGNPNILSIYTGKELEDATSHRWVIQWTSLKALRDFSASSPQLWGDEIQPEITLACFADTANLPIVLSAPVSEFAFAGLKDPETQQRWENCLQSTLEGMKMTKGAIAGMNGKEEGNSQQYVFIIGWESLKDHKAALSAEYAQEIYEETIALTHFKARHVCLSRKK